MQMVLDIDRGLLHGKEESLSVASVVQVIVTREEMELVVVVVLQVQ
jgi:hypothetical protein